MNLNVKDRKSKAQKLIKYKKLWEVFHESIVIKQLNKFVSVLLKNRKITIKMVFQNQK